MGAITYWIWFAYKMTQGTIADAVDRIRGKGRRRGPRK